MRRLSVGTRSVLFGAHCFALHPLFVALAWFRVYGLRRVPVCPDAATYRAAGVALDRPHRARTTHLLDPRLWVAFVVHDLGYIGKPNMDGPEGETHPEFGARIMGALFGSDWHDFALLHSRYYAKRRGLPYSALCVADKLVPALMPAWLYLPMARATGELAEYLSRAAERAASNEALSDAERRALVSGDASAWFRGLQEYMTRWALEHADGRADTWTASAPARELTP